MKHVSLWSFQDKDILLKSHYLFEFMNEEWNIKNIFLLFQFPSILLVAVAMFMACTLLPSEYSTETLLSLLFWGSMVLATGVIIMRYGPEFVDYPKLI